MRIEVGLWKEPISALSHFIGFLLALGGLFYLVVQTAHDSARLTAATLYGLGLISVFFASTAYHFLDLGSRGNRWLNQLDHMAIFLMIGGSYVPPAVQLLGGTWRMGVLLAVALCTLAGVLFKLLWFDCPLWLSTTLFLLMGWLGVIPLSQMYPHLTGELLFWLLSGGLAYTLGAIVYATERPDPWPQVFGHHEIWHVFVLLGAGCHFWFNSDILLRPALPV